LHGLRHAAGFIQSKLANRLKTRFTPVIVFVLDEGVKKSIEVSRLINEALAQSAAKTEPDPAEGTAEEELDS
jgi:ribosome-binding factor A